MFGDKEPRRRRGEVTPVEGNKVMTEGGIWGPGDRDSSRSLFGRPSPCPFAGALPSFIRPAPPRPAQAPTPILGVPRKYGLASPAPAPNWAHSLRGGTFVPWLPDPPGSEAARAGAWEGSAGGWEGSSAPCGRSGGGRSGGGRSGTDGGTHRGRGSRSRAGQARVPGRACPAWGRALICAGGGISFGTASSASAAAQR